MSMKLSENFTLTEFIKSQAGERLNIENTPTPEHLENIKNLVNKIIQPARTHFNRVFVINSGYRSVKLNKVIGGSATSQHCVGEAADIECPGISNYALAKYIMENFEFDQLILEFYTPGILDSGWVHVSLKRTGTQRRQVLTAVKEKGKTVYKQGLIQ